METYRNIYFTRKFTPPESPTLTPARRIFLTNIYAANDQIRFHKPAMHWHLPVSHWTVCRWRGGGRPPGRALYPQHRRHIELPGDTDHRPRRALESYPKGSLQSDWTWRLSAEDMVPHSSNRMSSTLILEENRSNPGLPHCRWILYQLSHQGSPVNIKRKQTWYKWNSTDWYVLFISVCFWWEYFKLYSLH